MDSWETSLEKRPSRAGSKRFVEDPVMICVCHDVLEAILIAQKHLKAI